MATVKTLRSATNDGELAPRCDPLYRLPSDIWQTLSEYLDSYDVVKLLMTGDVLLHDVLGAKGGVRRLRLPSLELWPSATLTYFNRLQHLHLWNNTGPTQLFRGFLEDINLLQLPKTLRKLVLEFPNALSALEMLPSDITLATLVPDLVTLKFGPQYIPSSFHGATFLSSLPREQLSTLVLPPSVNFGFADVEFLPPGLAKLSGLFYDYEVSAEAAKRWPQHLTKLHLYNYASTNMLMCLPPTLLALHAEYSFVAPHVNYLNATGRNVTVLARWAAIHFLRLPASLQRLTLRGIEPLTPDVIEHLPRGLTSLHANLLSGCFQQGILFPRGLTSLTNPLMQFHTFLTFDAALYASFPSSLTTIPYVPTDLSDTILRPLTHLRLHRMGDEEANRIPSSVTDLFVEFVATTATGNAALAKLALKVCNFNFPVGTGPIGRFPASLIDLTLIVSDWDGDTWLWPPGLRQLHITADSKSLRSPLDDFFATLPPSLTQLYLKCTDSVSYTNLHYLPRALKSLELWIETDENDKTRDSQLQGVPPRLEVLRLESNFCCLSAEAIATLPCSVREFYAVNTDSVSPPLVPAAQIYHHFAAHIPRTTHIGLVPPSPELEAWKNSVQALLVKICQNVHFGYSNRLPVTVEPNVTTPDAVEIDLETIPPFQRTRDRIALPTADEISIRKRSASSKQKCTVM